MRLIDADALNSIKFHPLPYTHIVPDDVNAESYQRGWNDAVDAIIENAPTIEPERKKGQWIKVNGKTAINCSACYHCSWSLSFEDTVKRFNFCPNCGARMEGER